MLSKHYIDINADLGEGIGNEALLMPSCKIACGGHAGDEKIMNDVLNMAIRHNVKVGAHPSFPDRESFGRQIIEMNNVDLFDSIMSQTITLNNIAEQQGVALNHIKPHGALYNLAAKDEAIAKLIVNIISSFSYKIKLYAPYNSVIAEIAKSENIEVYYEGFADRNYNDDLSLVSRKKSDALITKKEDVFDHVYRIVKDRKVKTVNRVEVELLADTICVHGDAKNAVDILKYLNHHLPANGVEIL